MSESIDVEPLLPTASQYIANFSVGFLRFGNNYNEEDLSPAGSGALVSIDSVHGILTAAHVLKALPLHGRVGLIRFTPSPTIQRLSIDLAYSDRLVIGGDGQSDDPEPKSPDIGFLRLTTRDVTTLEAAGSVFFNLANRRQSILAGVPSGNFYFEGIAGIVPEWSLDGLQEEGKYLLRGFRGMFGVGLVQREYELDGFDLSSFATSQVPPSKSPLSYKGVSGGALWRIYISKDVNGHTFVSDKQIFGCAFHQSPVIDKQRVITCHGPKSVYGKLYDDVQKRWASAA